MRCGRFSSDAEEIAKGIVVVMALPLVPIAIGAVALLAIFAMKKSNGSSGASGPDLTRAEKERYLSLTLDKTETRCGEKMTYIDAQIFDQGMNYLKIPDVKKLIGVYESRGQQNLANCLRAKHGL